MKVTKDVEDAFARFMAENNPAMRAVADRLMELDPDATDPWLTWPLVVEDPSDPERNMIDAAAAMVWSEHYSVNLGRAVQAALFSDAKNGYPAAVVAALTMLANDYGAMQHGERYRGNLPHVLRFIFGLKVALTLGEKVLSGVGSESEDCGDPHCSGHEAERAAQDHRGHHGRAARAATHRFQPHGTPDVRQASAGDGPAPLTGMYI